MVEDEAADLPSSSAGQTQDSPASARKSRGKLLKSAKKRTSILDAAAKVFARKGYAATLNEIAEEAGTQAGSLYYHFASRDQLIDEVIRISMSMISARVREAIEAMPQDATWLARIDAGLRAHVRCQLESPHYGLAYLKIVDQAPPEMQSRYLVPPREYGLLWLGMLQDAQAGGEIHADLSPHLIRRLMFGSMNNALRWCDQQHLPPPEQIVDNVCQIFLHGMARAPGAPATPPTDDGGSDA